MQVRNYMTGAAAVTHPDEPVVAAARLMRMLTPPLRPRGHRAADHFAHKCRNGAWKMQQNAQS